MLPLLLALTPQLQAPEPLVLPNAHADDRSALIHKLECPLVREDADGSVWVRGRSYKANVSSLGLLFLAPVGADGPTGAGAHFRLESATVSGAPIELASAPTVDRREEEVTLAHGAFRETFRIGTEAVEQTFLVPHSLGPGELVLGIGVDTTLSSRARAEGGFEFLTEGLGIRYGAATVFDANGRALSIESRWSDRGRIELVVPADFLASAAYPVLVDPLITVFQNNFDGDDDLRPDVAWSSESPLPEGSEYLMVWQEPFGPGDNDVYMVPVSLGGVVDASRVAAIDVSGRDWQRPAVAFQPGKKFGLVVAEETPFPGALRTIEGVFFTPNAATPSGYSFAPPEKLNTTQFDSYNADVAAWCTLDGSEVDAAISVVFEVVDSVPAESDIAHRSFTGAGLVFGTPERYFDPTADRDHSPRLPDWISSRPASSGAGLQFAEVVWVREDAAFGTSSIWNGRIIEGATTPVIVSAKRVTDGPNDGAPSLAMLTSRTVIAFERTNAAGTESTVMLAGSFLTNCDDPMGPGCAPAYDLRLLEGQGPGRFLERPELTGSQRRTLDPHFTVAYVERVPGGPAGTVGRVKAAIFDVVNLEPDPMLDPTGLFEGPALIERDVALGGPLLNDLDRPRGCSKVEAALSEPEREVADLALFAFENTSTGGLRGAIVDPDGIRPRMFPQQSVSPFGRQFCLGEVNVTGKRGWLRAWVALPNAINPFNDLELEAIDLPPNQFGFFLNGPDPAFVVSPGGSNGNLCLGGGVGRHLSTIQSSGPEGIIAADIDPDMLPRPSTFVVAMADETWGFQCWYRDGAGQSNFTNAVAATWQ
ncbi:MAG: hypothetical protein AAFU73_24090 [Planctomycetota bacterium]